VVYKAVRFYLSEHPLSAMDILTTVVKKVDNEKVVRIARELKLLPLIKTYLESVQEQNVVGVNEALNELYVDEEDFESLRHSIDTYHNFDPIVLARKLKGLDGLEVRRIAAYLYRENKQWEESIKLSKADKLYKDAMETAARSAKPEIAESLLRFFVAEKLNECFAACLFACYDLLKPAVAMELAWKSGQTNLAMPYMIQVIHEYTSVVDEITAEKKAKKEKREKEKNAPVAPVTTFVGPEGFVGPMTMVSTGPMSGGIIGMSPQLTGNIPVIPGSYTGNFQTGYVTTNIPSTMSTPPTSTKEPYGV